MLSSVRRGFDALMVLLYLGVGVVIILAEEQFNNLSTSFRILLGGIIILYGLFRIFKIYLQIKTDKEEEYEEEDGQ